MPTSNPDYPMAFVHPSARIGRNVRIDPFAYIEENVEIGDDCHIHSFVSILDGARIGNNNEIFQGAIIAATPQDFRWEGAPSYVRIGHNNKIREQVIINRSIHPEGSTEIGDDIFIMAQCHIGHDSIISHKSVLGNGVKIAGDVKIGTCTILSSGVIVHENCEIGDMVMIKGGTRVNNHVPPYIIMAHNPISYFGVNAVILRKLGYCEECIDEIAKCYRHIYQSFTSTYNGLKRIEIDVDQSPERDAILKFIRSHKLVVAGTAKESDL